MLKRLVCPPWLRLGLALPLLVLNLLVLSQLLLPLAPLPSLFLTAALLVFLLDIPSRSLICRGLRRWAWCSCLSWLGGRGAGGAVAGAAAGDSAG